MKNYRFDAKLIAARPVEYAVNAEFTDTVMKAIEHPEILSAHVRRMGGNKKETLFMKFKHLPKFAIVLIAIASLAAVSGTAYAAYHLLWEKPQLTISQPETSVSGRDEVSLSFAKCGKDVQATRYELKKNATITVEEIPAVLNARCELDAINSWAQTEYPETTSRAPEVMNQPFTRTMLMTSMATHIKSFDEASITFEGLTKYNEVDSVLAVTSDTRYIADGQYVSRDAITTDDPVVYITKDASEMTPRSDCTETSCGYSGTSRTRTLLAVVKLSGTFKDYDQLAWQSLTERTTCEGNEADSCVAGFAAAVDLYQGASDFTDGQTYKEIQGVVTAIEGSTVTIRSSSGSLFVITAPTDVIAYYNTNKAAQYYQDQKVKLGSSLTVRYSESATQHSKTIQAKQLTSMQLQFEIVSKGDPVQAY